MRYCCTGCRWYGHRAVGAGSHEAATGHRVVLWDSSTSQMPRSFWTPETRGAAVVLTLLFFACWGASALGTWVTGVSG